MPHADYYKSGDYNAECSMCGGKFKAGELRKHWQGMYRCARCWEPRQPQDFVKAPPPETPPPWIQPPNDVFAPLCSAQTRSAVPGSAGPGCAIPSYIFFGAQPVDLAEGTASVWWGNGPAPVPTNTSWPAPPGPPGFTDFAYIASSDSTTMGMGVVAAYRTFDGATWEAATSPCIIVYGVAASRDLQRIVLFGDIADDGSPAVFYSDDYGDTWTQGSMPAGIDVTQVGAPYCVLYSTYYNRFFASAEATAIGDVVVVESADGITWTQAATTVRANLGLIFSHEGSVVCPVGDNRYLWTTNGSSWSVSTGSAFATNNAVWADHLSAFFKGRIDIYTSADGITWSIAFNPASNMNAYALAYSPSLERMSAGADGSWYSDDGTTWTQGNTPAAAIEPTRQVLWSPTWSRFYSIDSFNPIVTETTFIYSSLDGIDWTLMFQEEWITGSPGKMAIAV